MKTCLHTTFFRDNGRPLVLLHGFMGSAASFSTLAGILPDGLRPVGIDLPGHGKSLFSKSACLAALESFGDAAEMILEDLSRAGIDRFFLYGYSMGGRIAQQVALAAPERIHALLVESAAFGITDPDERQKRYRDDCRMLDNIRTPSDFEAFLERWQDMALFHTLSDDQKCRLKASKKTNPVIELKQALSLLSVGNQPYLLPELAQAPFPMAFLYGREDARYMAIAANVRASLPTARFFYFPNASHDIHTPYPEKVALTIAAFIVA